MSVAVVSASADHHFANEVAPAPATPMSQERVEQVRLEANKYIERHNLRMVMQDLFKRLVQERPDDPAEFMQKVLAKPDDPTRADREELQAQLRERLHEIEDLRARLTQAEQTVASSQQAEKAAAAEAQTARAELLAREAHQDAEWEQQYKMQIAQHKGTIQALHKRIEELEAAATEEAISDSRAELQKQVESQQTKMEVLNLRIQVLESAATSPNREAAAASTDTAAGRAQEAAVNMAAGPGLFGAAKPAMAFGSSGATSMGPPPLGTLPSDSQAGSDVNTHMLSQFLASTYAQPMPSTSYISGPGEHQEDVEIIGPNPDVLVEVINCKDAMTNGLFAWVGFCNLRPMYRLLGPEPRYLYYAEVNIASGWRIVCKMGSEECLERFRKPTDAWLPVHCEVGDCGAQVVDAKLSAQVAAKISMISNNEERIAVRGKFTEVFGTHFTKLEGQHRGLISKATPVVGVAHALEAQQRVIQLLSGRLAAEAQRREAAESQAQCMEEAFETMQLRIQAQLPGRPTHSSLVALQQQAKEQQLQPLKATAQASPAPLSSAPVQMQQLAAAPVQMQQFGSSRPSEPEQVPAENKRARTPPPREAPLGFMEASMDTNTPLPHPPMSPKEVKPGCPTFRRMSSSKRGGLPSELAGGSAASAENAT